jgi:hypothetical protein
MTEQQLIKDINEEITFSGMLPYSLPDKEIKRQIEISVKYFWDNWRHAVEPRYMVLPKELFHSKIFKRNRQIQLPDCVQFVTQVKTPTGGSIFGTMDRDFSESKFIGSEVFLTPFIGESIMYRTVIFSFLDLTRGLVLDTIAYDYNKNSKLLTIIGRTPNGIDAVIQIYKTLEKDKLYEDEIFQRYVRAKCKVRLAHMLQTFKYTLPGDVSISYESITATATEELKEVLEMMKGENTTDWIYLYRQ